MLDTRMKDLTFIHYYTQTWTQSRTCRCVSLTRQPDAAEVVIPSCQWGGKEREGEPSLQNKQNQTTHTNCTIMCL